CPLESTKPKNEAGSGTVTPAFRSPWAGTKSFIHNRLTVRRRDFADVGLLVSNCRQEAYLSMPACHQQSVNASSSTACGVGGVRHQKSKFAKRTWNVLWNQRNLKTRWRGRRLHRIPFARGMDQVIYSQQFNRAKTG